MSYTVQHSTGFDPSTFISDLITAMNMQNESPENQEALKAALEERMSQLILEAVSLHIEPAVIDTVMTENAGEKNNDLIFAELIAGSPEAQWAILDALDEFREETLATYALIRTPST